MTQRTRVTATTAATVVLGVLCEYAEASVGGGEHRPDHHRHHRGPVELLRRAAWQDVQVLHECGGGQELELLRCAPAGMVADRHRRGQRPGHHRARPRLRGRRHHKVEGAVRLRPHPVPKDRPRAERGRLRAVPRTGRHDGGRDRDDRSTVVPRAEPLAVVGGWRSSGLMALPSPTPPVPSQRRQAEDGRRPMDTKSSAGLNDMPGSRNIKVGYRPMSQLKKSLTATCI